MDSLRDQVDVLREELGARRREVQELHILTQQLQTRALPAPKEAAPQKAPPTQYSPQAQAQGQVQVEPQREEEPQPPPKPEKEKVPWWKFRWR